MKQHEGIDIFWPTDTSGTSIHHTFIQQTRGSNISMKGSNVRVYDNLRTHSENPMISVKKENVGIAFNTSEYGSNDAFVYLDRAPVRHGMEDRAKAVIDAARQFLPGLRDSLTDHDPRHP